MKSYGDLVAEALTRVKEVLPWDLSRRLSEDSRPLLLDVREPAEFDALRIPGWNDFEQPLENGAAHRLDADQADELLAPHLRPEQLKPKK